MYTEQLELLIDSALIDGVISDKEREIILKKAILSGFTYEEFEMVLNAKIDKYQKNMMSNKYGEVIKCPACGAIVQSYQGKCNECGVEFEYIEANLSSVKLSEELKSIDVKFIEKLTNVYTSKRFPIGASRGRKEIDNNNAEKDKVKAQLISAFPVPSTKADLIEFVTTMKVNANNRALSCVLRESYITKYRECMLKAQNIFPDDAVINRLSKDFEKFDGRIRFYGWEKFMESTRRWVRATSLIGWIVYFTLFFFIIGLCVVAVDEIKNSRMRKELRVALENDDIYKAKAIVMKGIGSKELYIYLMNEGLYDEASEYVGSQDVDYYKYMESVVNALCRDGKKEEASKFINRKVFYFDKNVDGQYTTEIVFKRLTAIVDNY